MASLCSVAVGGARVVKGFHHFLQLKPTREHYNGINEQQPVVHSLSSHCKEIGQLRLEKDGLRDEDRKTPMET